MKTTMKKPLSIAMGATFAAAMATSPVASADSNPFGMQNLENGYMQVAEGKCGQGKCGANKMKKSGGKCGANMKKTMAKSKERKCGDKMKAKAKSKDGKCGANKMKAKKEGKCGGKMKGSM